MRSPEPVRRPEWVLFKKELAFVFSGRALWFMLLVLSPLVGYGFLQAVELFAEASRSALQFPELARGMSPLDGILVPTFGAFYLGNTLLYPFVAIRMIGTERQSGSLKLLLQLPLSPQRAVAVKALALGAAWLAALLPGLSALLAWALLGGHLSLPETADLLLGHALYAFAVTGLAFFAAAVTESSATAAIVALAFTLGSWVLDFAATGHAGWLRELAFLSLTSALRAFEQGLLATPQALQLLILGIVFLGLAVVWLPTGKRRRARLGQSAALVGVCAAVLLLALRFPLYFDLTEDRRNSFNPADEQALNAMREPLRITVYLSPDDSRLQEMERNVLAKLRRTVPHLTVVYAPTGKAGLFGAASEDDYGLIVYEYQGRRDQSRSNSPREILPLLHGLAGQRVTGATLAEYPGYPLVAASRGWGAWFYGALPGLFCLAWWWTRRPPRNRITFKGGAT